MSGLDLALSMSSNPLVFIVDGDADQRHRLAVMLESHRHAVCAFASGRQFLDRLNPMQAGCILLGLELGDMHGLGVLQALREEGYTLPVIVLDGGADKATIIQLMKLGVDEVLQVPTVTNDQVLSAVYHALEADAKNRMQHSEACALSQRFASLCPREQEFRNMAESSPDAIMRYDREGRILYLNQKLYRDLGVTQAELIGKTTGEVWPDNRFADIAQAVMRAIGSGEAATAELSHPLATGELIFSQIRVAAERDAAGRIVGALAFGRDITAVREAERKLRHFVDSLPGLAFIFRLSPDGHGCFPFVSSAIEEIYGLGPEDVKDDMAPLLNLAHPDDRPRIEATIAESARTMALIRVEFRVCRPGQPERWIDCRSVPTREADGAILWHGIMLDITERKQAEALLVQREREFRTLAENSPDNIARWDSQGRYVYLNPTHERTLATTAADVIGKRIREAFPDGRFTPIETAMPQVVATGEAVLFVRQPVPAENGEMRIHDVKLVPEFDQAGQVVSVLGIGRDMTDIYRMQEAIAARAQEFRSLAENMPDVLIRYDREGRRTYVNPALIRNYAIRAEQMLGLKQQESNPFTMPETYRLALEHTLASGERNEFELQIPTSSGDMRTNLIFIVAERAADEQISGAITIGHDITAVREAERKLRHFVDNLPGLAFIFRISPDGRGCFPFVSSAIEEIYGLRPEDVKDDMAPLHNLAHPDDRPRIEAAIAESARTMTPFRVEFRVCRPGLPERWMDARSVADREADGGILWYGLMLDITERNVLDMQLAERKRVEAELRALQAQLREQAIRDPLTGLYNRRYLDETLRRELARAERDGHPLNILMVDVDHFKQLNDTYGHPAGDEMLRLLGGLLQNHARSSDIPCRYGGEEFVLVLPDMSPEVARGRAERVRRDFADLRMAFGGTEIAATLSIGVSTYPGHGKTADELIRAADLALYEAKQSGRNRVCYARSSDH
jgi:diguanylate cyclase (GGDEF)-like protein/PAS domain S-box-containing protein